MYDEAVLGEISSHEECVEYLAEYDSDWYMGKDTDVEWTKAVLDKKPNLFSLGRNMEDVSIGFIDDDIYHDGDSDCDDIYHGDGDSDDA